MSCMSKGIILGLLTGILGVVISVIPFGFSLEENVGLHILFELRGTRHAPPDAIVVNVDKVSADNLNLPDDLRKWPRSLNGRLVENLTRKGAAVIAFDISFLEPTSPREDNAFADAVEKARNVVLCKCLKREKIPLTVNGGRTSSAGLNIVSLMPPIPPLSKSALALAPFPLPRVPVRVNQYWTFKTVAGNTPTLPVVVFQIFTMQAYEEFIRLLEMVSPDHAGILPRNKDEIVNTKSVERVIQGIREIFESEPQIAEKMIRELQNSQAPSLLDKKKNQLVQSLIRMYQSDDSQYLNFYGPPHTITTIPYYRIVATDGKTTSEDELDVKGKAVFVGHSPVSQQEQLDRFYTVFSQPDGLDISGVEIAATAFANLLETKPVHPFRLAAYASILFLWGVAIGIVCRIFRGVFGSLTAVGLGILYLAAAEYQFKTAGLWYPIVLPLFFQLPVAIFGAVVWKYVDSVKERKNIRAAFQRYLPEDVVDQVTENISAVGSTHKVVYGICLSTDAEQYTSLSETMAPEELGSFMQKYYEAAFNPIRSHGGIISDIKGDSILALWVASGPEATLRYRACLAALDIANAINRFKQDSHTVHLPTRIGLHSGNILIGSIGAMDHYEYRPVGDIVNTATRMEGLNKHIGTRILVSEEVISQLGGLLTREIGTFLLAGKSKPVVVHELVCQKGDCSEQQRKICEIFAGALHAFRERSWDGAIEKFLACIKHGDDGPSRFYLGLCEHYKNNPPGESWDGVIRMGKK
jgi:adenylate cyclase